MQLLVDTPKHNLKKMPVRLFSIYQNVDCIIFRYHIHDFSVQNKGKIGQKYPKFVKYVKISSHENYFLQKLVPTKISTFKVFYGIGACVPQRKWNNTEILGMFHANML